MEFLNNIKGAIGWLGGALAALTAICYGAGYFSYHAHLTMLGLNGTVDFTLNQMLLEGSQFFLGLLSELLFDAFIAVFLTITAILAWMLAKRIGPVARASRAVAHWIRRRWMRATAAHPQLASAALLLLLTAVLILHHDAYFDGLITLGGVRHLLFDPVGPLPCEAMYDAPAQKVGLIASRLIVRGDACRNILQDQFVWFVRGFFLLLLVVGGAAGEISSHLPARVRSVAKIGLGLYTTLYLLWLPVAYGVLVRSPIYPWADVTIKDAAKVHARLLSQDGGGVLIWQDVDRSAIWFPAGRIESLKVTQVGNIFERERTKR